MPTPTAALARRWAAGSVVLVVVVGFAGPVRKAADDTRLVRSATVQATADAQVRHLTCVREALESVPDRPTFVLPPERGANVEWYQRAFELGFGEVPFVRSESDAEQVLEIVVDEQGDEVCGVLGVRIRDR